MARNFDFTGTLYENGKRILTSENVPDIIRDALNQSSNNSSTQIETAMTEHLAASNPHTITPELIGAASLDANGKILSSQLPSYVDDVEEYNSKDEFPTSGESGKIYVDIDKNTTYRWSGSTYVIIAGSLTLGTTSSTAFRGDLGNAAHEHSLISIGNPHGVTKDDVKLGDVVNTGDSDTPIQGGTTKFTTGGAYTELNKKVDKEIGKGLSTNDFTTAEKEKLANIDSGANLYEHPNSHPASMIDGLAVVATTGNYSDLNGIPNDKDTTYELYKNGYYIELIGSDGSKSSVVDYNTQYGAAGSTFGLVQTGGNVTIDNGIITVNDYEHKHTIDNVDGLNTVLSGKANSNHGTHVLYSTSSPVQDGTASPGTASTVSRSDHVHPTDTSRAPMYRYGTVMPVGTKLAPGELFFIFEN